MDESPPASKASRLNAAQKRQLKTRLTEFAAEGGFVTLPRLHALAAEVLALDITKGLAERLLAEFGWRMGNDLDPSLSESGALETVHIWEPVPVARPLSPAEKAQALAERMRVLSDAFVEDLMEDPLLKFASLDDIAGEATRSFALSLREAVVSRARFGAKTILPACGDIAQLTFKGGSA
jgi:hypothetical protein